MAPVGRRIAGTEIGRAARVHRAARARPVRPARPRRPGGGRARRRGLLRRTEHPRSREALRVPPARLPAVDRDPRGHAPRPVHRRAVDEALLPVARRSRRSTSSTPTRDGSCTRCAGAADELRQGRNPLDDGGIVALLATDEQRGVLAQVQALMSVLEGHGNAVMNQLGHEHVAGQERMARVLSARRRSRGMSRRAAQAARRSSRRCASTRSARRSSTRSSARAAPARSTQRGGAPSRCRRSTSCARRRVARARRLTARSPFT